MSWGQGQQGGYGGHQQFESVDNTQPFYPTQGRRYKIVCAQDPNYSLGCSQNPNSKNKLILWDYHGQQNQQWEFRPCGNNTFAILNAANGGTVEIPDHSNTQAGVQLCVNQPNGTINETWIIRPAEGQSAGQGFSIASAYNGLCLDVSGGSC